MNTLLGTHGIPHTVPDMVPEQNATEDGQRDADTDGRNVTNINTTTGSALSDLLRPTLGPTGRDKLLVDTNGMVIVTNDGATILGELDVETDIIPAARLLLKLSQSQRDRFGDGTKTVVILAGELLRQVDELLDLGLHPTTIISGFDSATRLLTERLEEVAVEVPTDDSEWLARVAEMAMAGRGAVMIDRVLAEPVVEAVRTVYDDGRIDTDNITIMKVPGGVIKDSQLFPGLLVDTPGPVLLSMPRSVEDARIACINNHLELPTGTRDDSEVKIRNVDELQRMAEYEDGYAERLVGLLEEHGINVVFCEKEIGQTMRVHLASHGILAVKRAKGDDIKHIARATGATVVPEITQMDAGDVGRADLVELRRIGREDVFAIEGCENPKSRTLLLRGGTKHILDESERIIKNSLAVVETTFRANQVVPGGGAMEIECARVIRERANAVAGREQLAMQAYANALEVIPRTLAENMTYDPVTTLSELQAKHEAGEVNAGVVPENGVVDDLVKEGIVQPLNVKKQAVSNASEAVGQILRIDDIVRADDLSEYDF